MKLTTLERPGTVDRAGARPSGAVRTPPPGADRATRAHGRRGTQWVVAGGVIAVLTLGGWSLAAGSSAVSPAGPGELGLVGGVAHVDAVVSASRPKHAMPGMGTDSDPVADDERRISVDVTLRADEDRSLEYVARRFRLAPEGAGASAPHKLVLPQQELPPGTSLSGTLIYDVPLDATTAVLSYGEERTTVELPAEATGAAPAPGAPAPTDAHDAGH